MLTWTDLERLLERALAARTAELGDLAAVRLFNGFTEGFPELVIDRFGGTLVLYNYAQPPEKLQPLLPDLLAWLLRRQPPAETVLLKTRFSHNAQARRGVLLHGAALSDQVEEQGVQYALDLTLNQDSGFYLDTRPVRAWLIENSAGRLVLNTFAYTGSLGAAALAGGAQRVLQTDRSDTFLAVAKRTYALNHWPVRPKDFRIGDFFNVCAQLKSAACLFDCVILDPPFFSKSTAGRVDWAAESQVLINKVRPLVAHNGHLIVINNALFLSGADFMTSLQALCASGYLSIEALLPVPSDVTGTQATRSGLPPADPAPFNHPTKMAILRVLRKDQAAAHCP